MIQEELQSKTFIGKVEDNADPKKLGRCRVRVFNLFDDIPVNDIPWATPWKDLNGNTFILPDVGKIVSVVFDSGNIYKPEYIFAEHFNINLEKKLSELSGDNYKSMRALMFDHKTQIYSNDEEGLKVDYKFNNINITKDNINLNLKDNFGHVNIGSPGSNQQAILGNHFLNWFDKFINTLTTTGFFGNSGALIAASPDMLRIKSEYYSLREPKFLSHHVNVVDNQYVEKQTRIAEAQIGDNMKSTIKNLPQVSAGTVDYAAKSGLSTDTPEGQLTTHTDENGNPVAPPNEAAPPITPSNNPDIDKIVRTMERKGYVVLTKPYELNIVGVRRQYEGDRYSNAFKDDLYVFYKTAPNTNWEYHKFRISTMPGFYYGNEYKTTNKSGKEIWKFKVNANSSINVKQSRMMLGRGRTPNNGMGILMEAQYLGVYYIGQHSKRPALKTFDGVRGQQKFYRDNSPEPIIKYTGRGRGTAAMFVHAGFPGGTYVNNWSEGCQVFASSSEFDKFFELCNEHKTRNGNKFNYTLMLEKHIS